MNIREIHINYDSKLDISNFELITLKKLIKNPKDSSISSFIISLLEKKRLIVKSKDFYISKNKKIYFYDLTPEGKNIVNQTSIFY